MREAAVAAEIVLGLVDIVMNNVGAIVNGNPEDIPLGEWERALSLNLLSVVRSNAVFLPRMLAWGRGYIVNVGSFARLYTHAASRMRDHAADPMRSSAPRLIGSPPAIAGFRNCLSGCSQPGAESRADGDQSA